MPPDQSIAHESHDALDTEVQLRVSMKHVLLASRRARAMFSGDYKESKPGTDGLRHWRLRPFFDPEAFTTVMEIVHGHTREIPDQVSLCMLTAIATVVDDLQCRDAVWFFAKIWIRKLQATVPEQICDDLPRWILVAFVFSEPEIFLSVTRVAILHSRDALSTGGLPIYPRIIGMSCPQIYWFAMLIACADVMEAQRQESLDKLMAHLHTVMDSLSRGKSSFTFQCRSTLLGSLIQDMCSAGLLFPEPSKPFVGRSLYSTIQDIRGFQSPGVYAPENDAYNEPDLVWRLDHGAGAYSSSKKKKRWTAKPVCNDEEDMSVPSGPSGLAHLLEPNVRAVEAEINGLALSDFAESPPTKNG